MNDLPENVVQIEVLRINRNIDKRCKCHGRNFIVDPQNREVCCDKCGARVDAFDAINELATHYERLGNQLKQLYEQRREIASYKPWLVTIRKIEQQYRGRKMLPCCPHCSRAFYLEELTLWTNEELERRRRAKT